MSRMIKVLTVFAAVSLILLIPFGILESNRTPDWQTELSRYLNMLGVSVEEIQHVEVAEARHPGQFATQTAPTPTPTAAPPNRSDPTAEPTPSERYFPPPNVPLPAELAAPRSG